MESGYALAFDMGATSTRAVLGHLDDGRLVTAEIARFQDYFLNGACDRWNLPLILENLTACIRRAMAIAGQRAGRLESVAFDTWGVDYVSVCPDGSYDQYPYTYRNPRTAPAVAELSARIGEARLYRASGIYPQPINTIYQLFRTVHDSDFSAEQVSGFLLLPDFLNWYFTGVRGAEYSIASTTGLFDPRKRAWDEALICELDMKPEWFAGLQKAGTRVGKILRHRLGGLTLNGSNNLTVSGLSSSNGLNNADRPDAWPDQPDARPDRPDELPAVIRVLAHDTASAVLALPVAEPDRFVFLSCGTWSVLGTVLPEPLISRETFEQGFSNEIGADGCTLLLRNITGLFLFERLRAEFMKQGVDLTFSEIEAACRSAPTARLWLDVDRPEFAGATSLIRAIQIDAERTGQPFYADAGFLYRTLYESLAMKYRLACRALKQMTAVSNRLYLTGGGSKSEHLSQLIANATGMTVIVGLSEAAAAGNLLMQMIAKGALRDVSDARRVVRHTSGARSYDPTVDFNWAVAETAYTQTVGRA